MLHVGDTVKVLCTTMYNDQPTELIKIGSICKVIETDGIWAKIIECDMSNRIESWYIASWYKEDELEKGHLEWVKG